MHWKKYHLLDKPMVVSPILPGKRASELLAKQEQYESNNRSYPRGIPLAPKRAKGTIIEDVDGNYFMDFFSLCGVVNLGHNNEDIIRAISKQLNELIHAMDYPTETKVSFMEVFNTYLPEQLKDMVKFNFCGPTGSDAVEAAIKLAIMNSGKNSLISFQGSYHGMTAGSLSVTSSIKHKRKLNSTVNDVTFIPYGYCYRCPYDKTPGSCKVECATHLEKMLDNPHSGLNEPAAIILEPIQGEGGIIIPQRGFHTKIRTICNERNITLIHDEIQSGFFRTGKLLSSEHFGVKPDIVTMSKGIGGAGVPISLLLIDKNLDNWEAGTHAGTFRGHQLGMAAGIEAFNFIAKNNVVNHIDRISITLIRGLEEILKTAKYIGEVRGLGLFVGVEYVKNKKSKEPYSHMCYLMRQKLFETGILIEIGGYYSNVIRILPPLITTEKMIQIFLEEFEKVNKELELSSEIQEFGL